MKNVDGSIILSIIIASYNARDLLKDCLESIYKNPPACSFEVFVVDDHSHDGSYEMTLELFPQVRASRNERNLHYARSNNRVFDKAKGRYIYLLNSDTLMLPGSLDKMVEFLEAHPRVGSVGSKLLNEDGSVQASVKTLPSVMSGFFGARSPMNWFFPNNPGTKKHLLHLSKDMSEPFKAGYVSSASVMFPRETVREVGYLDYRLSYHVDADYCARVWEKGWEVYFLPEAVVIHLDHKGGTQVSRKRRFKSILEFHYGSFIYYQKHEMTSYFHPLTFIVVLGLSVRFVASLLMQQTQELFRK